MGVLAELTRWQQVRRGVRLARVLSGIDHEYADAGRIEGADELVRVKESYESWVRAFPADLEGVEGVAYLSSLGKSRLAMTCRDLSDRTTDVARSDSYWREASHWYVVIYNDPSTPGLRANAAEDLAVGLIKRNQLDAAATWLRLLTELTPASKSDEIENLWLQIEAKRRLQGHDELQS